MREHEFFQALKKRFPSNEYAMVPQVRNTTGVANKVRTADAIGVSLWPSRGIDLHGFEFKDSRSDWLKELSNGAKAEEIGRHCAYWWLCISDKKIVIADELPTNWGLILVNEDWSSKVLTKAPRRQFEKPDITFLAAVLRAAQDVVTDEYAIQQRVNKAVSAKEAEMRAAAQTRTDREMNTVVLREQELAKKVKAFEDSAGFSITNWGSKPAEVGKAVKFVLDGGLAGTESKFKEIIRVCDYLKHTCEGMLTDTRQGTTCPYCDKISGGPAGHALCEKFEQETTYEDS